MKILSNNAISIEQQQELIDKTVEWLVEGMPDQEIVQSINYAYPKRIKESDARTIIDEAMEKIKATTDMNPETVIPSHVEMYEKIYNYFQEIGYDTGMLKVLKAKERLLKLFEDKNKLTVNNKKNIKIKKEVTYDTSKLTSEENARLRELLKEAGG